MYKLAEVDLSFQQWHPSLLGLLSTAVDALQTVKLKGVLPPFSPLTLFPLLLS